MSNTSKMSVEELLVQNIKDDKLYSLVNDEDALTKLVQRAITEALFQPRTVPDGRGYGNKISEDAPAVAAAREAARQAAEKMVGKIMEVLFADKDFGEVVIKAVANAIPQAAENLAQQWVVSAAKNAHVNSMQAVREFVHQTGGKVPWQY